MRDEEVSTVGKISLLSNMNDENFDKLIKVTYLQLFPPQLEVFKGGNPADFLHVLVDGDVELVGSLNNHESTMVVIRAGSPFSMASVLLDRVYLMSARTLNGAKILLKLTSLFASAMMRELAEEYRSVMNTFKEQKLRNCVERLGNFLLRSHEQTPGMGQLMLAEDRCTLAVLLGMSPEHLSRSFCSLQEYGVETHGSKIGLTNLASLKRRVRPDAFTDDHKVQIMRSV